MDLRRAGRDDEGSQATRAMVRPERLFALRAHPFGVALRAINIASGQLVELPASWFVVAELIL
jgi:hypothetical protein